MNIFSSTNFTWWQLGLLKWAVLFLGLAIGSSWPSYFAPYALPLAVLGLLASCYLAVVWFRGKQ